MKALPIVLAALFAFASAAHAQSVPAGSGTLPFKEKLKTPCGGFADAGTLVLVLNANETWSAEAPAGNFAGTMTPLDARGRSWRLDFDGPSLAAYEAYLEDEATDLCSSPVSISNLALSLVVKMGKNGTQASATLKASATGVAALFAGNGKHQLEAKGAFSPGVFPTSGGAGVVLVSFPWFEGTYFTAGPQ
jgi:hypothetical protein